MRYLLTIIFSLIPIIVSAQTVTHGMTIPTGSPVPLFYLAADLTALQTRYNAATASYPAIGSNPTTCATSPNNAGCDVRSVHQGFLRKMGGSCAAADGGAITTCGDAVTWFLAADCEIWYDLDDEDQSRYVGENLILTLWLLWDDLTSGQRETAITCFIRAIAADNVRPFGSGRYYTGGGHWADIASNYNWGFMRNTALLAVLIYNENSFTFPATTCTWSGLYNSFDYCNDSLTTIAESLLDEFETRLDNLQAYLTTHRGGVMADGSPQYGPYLLHYISGPMTVYQNYGRSIITETAWWTDAAWYWLLAETPKTSYSNRTGATIYHTLSYGADNATSGAAGSQTYEAVTYLATVARLLNGTSLENYIRYWLTQRDVAYGSWFKILDAELGVAGTDIATINLPKEYYGTGNHSGILISRNTWSHGAGDKPTIVYAQLGAAYGHHMDCDVGNIQIWRNGRWLLRESAGYGLAGINLPDSANVASDIFHVWAVNSATIAGSSWGNPTNLGSCIGGLDDGAVLVQRLNRELTYTFADTNLLNVSGVTATSFRLQVVTVPAYNLVFTRHLMRTSSSVTKERWVHCATDPPTVSSDAFICTNGDEALKHWFLWPSGSGSVTYTERDEDGFDADCPGADCDSQFRVEGKITGTSNDILMVHHAYSTGDTVASIAFTQDTDPFIVTATIGGNTIAVTWPSGTTTTGGTISFDGAAATTFDSGIDEITVNSTEYTWGDAAPPPGSIGRPASLPRRFAGLFVPFSLFLTFILVGKLNLLN